MHVYCVGSCICTILSLTLFVCMCRMIVWTSRVAKIFKNNVPTNNRKRMGAVCIGTSIYIEREEESEGPRRGSEKTCPSPGCDTVNATRIEVKTAGGYSYKQQQQKTAPHNQKIVIPGMESIPIFNNNFFAV